MKTGGPDGTKRQDHRLWGWESWKNRGLWSADDVNQVEMNENDGPEPKMRISREQGWTPPGGIKIPSPRALCLHVALRCNPIEGPCVIGVYSLRVGIASIE